MNILLIGNSYSYYWPDELWGLLNAAGYEDVTICNVYYSGCTFEKHWNWHVAGEGHYRLVTNDSEGRRQEEGIDLETAVARKNWDIISLQQGNSYIYRGGVELHRASMEPHLPLIYNYLLEKFPNAKYYWHQSWAHGIGYGVSTLEKQQAVTQGFRVVSDEICQQYPFTKVPCGDAWEMVRYHPVITEGGKQLTTRIRKENPMYDDLTHDGDHGGGQYLNACVWFEMLTRKSVIGNTFRPKYMFGDVEYPLGETKVALLQHAAHAAVIGVYGPDYTK